MAQNDLGFPNNFNICLRSLYSACFHWYEISVLYILYLLRENTLIWNVLFDATEASLGMKYPNTVDIFSVSSFAKTGHRSGRWWRGNQNFFVNNLSLRRGHPPNRLILCRIKEFRHPYKDLQISPQPLHPWKVCVEWTLITFVKKKLVDAQNSEKLVDA